MGWLAVIELTPKANVGLLVFEGIRNANGIGDFNEIVTLDIRRTLSQCHLAAKDVRLIGLQLHNRKGIGSYVFQHDVKNIRRSKGI